MKQYIQIRYTKDNLMAEDKTFQTKSCRENVKKNDSKPQMEQSIFESVVGVPEHINTTLFDCTEGFPNLSEPFPQVSLKAQLHIAAKNRKQLKEYEQGFEQRLQERWLANQEKKEAKLTAGGSLPQGATPNFRFRDLGINSNLG